MKKIIFCLFMPFTYQVFAMSDNPIVSKDQQIEMAIKDLSQRQDKTDSSEIKLTSISEITWRSGALGCPRPNEQYTQALVPGVLILLSVGDKAYRYHARSDGSPFYCPDKFSQTPSLPDSAL